jgi:hypothetical protein
MPRDLQSVLQNLPRQGHEFVTAIEPFEEVTHEKD